MALHETTASEGVSRSTHCKAPQRTATHCNTLRHTATQYLGAFLSRAPPCNAPQRSATHYNSLQHTAKHCNTLQRTATHCKTLQRTATHCNTLQHTTFQFTKWHSSHVRPSLQRGNPLTLQHTATHCNTLQHTATHCNTLHFNLPRDTPLMCAPPYQEAILSRCGVVCCSVLQCVAVRCSHGVAIRHTVRDYSGNLLYGVCVCVCVCVRVCACVCVCERERAVISCEELV